MAVQSVIHPTRLTYRADIDGLRALAVLLVILYHARVSFVPGGYIGVDVFFVVSGYLITSIILQDIRAGKFSIVKFYERRIRRIFPALFFVVVTVLTVGALLLIPHIFRDLGKSALATSLFSSNFLFWSEANDYFNLSSRLKPLLHTWSLAVEEQYYIVFPWLMLLAWRCFRKHIGWMLTGIAVLSFGLSAYYTNHDPTSAYYLPQFRVWELMIGSLLVLHPKPLAEGSAARIALAVCGVGMILTSAAIFNETTPFPGWAALLPTLGTAFIIYSGENGGSPAHRLLSIKPLVFIGLISYSLYLWHWPVLVFSEYYNIVGLNPYQTALALLVVLALSILSWRFVETPFRISRIQTKRIFGTSAAVLTLTSTIGWVVLANGGFPARFDQTLAKQNEKILKAVKGRCKEPSEERPDLTVCVIGAAVPNKTFVLWGDSHATALAPAVHFAASNNQAAGYFLANSACPPLLGIKPNWSDKNCDKLNEETFALIENNPQIKKVILASRWAFFAEGTRYKSEDGAGITLTNTGMDGPREGTDRKLFELGLNRTIAELLRLKRQIVIISEVPEIGYDVPTAFWVGTQTGRDINAIIAPTYQEYLQRNEYVTGLFDSLSARYGIEIIEPSQVLCDDSICRVVLDGYPMYVDNNHLAPLSAPFLTRLLNSAFRPGH